MLLWAEMANRKSRAAGAAIQCYLIRTGLSQQDFASRLGVTQGTVSQWINGKIRISPERAADIIRLTQGKVSREILFPELFNSV